VPLEATSTKDAQNSRKLHEPPSVALKSLQLDTSGAEKQLAATEATAAASAAAAFDASLRLTVFSAAAGEAVANVAVPLLVDASGLTSNVLGGFGACWWSGLALNITGSAMSGFASGVEQEASSKDINRPRAATAAASLRGGFLGAYTSFAGMALQAGEFTSSSNGSAGAAMVAGSLGLGAMAFAFGRYAAYCYLPLFFPPTSPAKIKFDRAVADVSTDTAETAPPVALELTCLISMWLCLLIADDSAPDLAMGMLCAALAALVGTVTDSSNSAANAWATSLALVVRVIPLLGPNTLPSLAGSTLLLKFEGSFCGALSTFCGAAEDLTVAAISIHSQLFDISRGISILNDSALRSFASSALIAAFGAFCSAYIADIENGSGNSIGPLIQFDQLSITSIVFAVLAIAAASAYIPRQTKA